MLPLVLCGCERKMADPEGALKEKAEQYWTERLMNHNFQYTYKEELNEGRAPFPAYEKIIRARSSFKVSSVRVEKVKIEGDQGAVTLQITCMLPRVPKEIDVPLGDHWVIKENQWKHLFEMESK